MTWLTDMEVREWAWSFTGRPELREMARLAALRVVDVWETVPQTILLDVFRNRGIGPAHALRVLPRELLTTPVGVASEPSFHLLLRLLHVLAWPDGHGPHGHWYDPRMPPYQVDASRAESWLLALSSCVHAISAALWTPEWVSVLIDPAEREAETVAGPIRQAAEACVSSALARPVRAFNEILGKLT